MIPSSKSTPERLMQLIEIVGQNPDGVTFSALKEAMGGIAPTTLTRVLTPLLASAFIAKDAKGHYIAGSKLRTIARCVSGAIGVEDIMPPVLRDLAESTQCSAAYFHWDGQWPGVSAKHELPEHFHYAPLGNRKHPVTHTFLRPIWSYLPPTTLAALGAAIPETIQTSIVHAGFYDQIEGVDRFQIRRITAPVFYGERPRIAGCIGITSIQTELTGTERDRFVSCVMQSADRASHALRLLPAFQWTP